MVVGVVAIDSVTGVATYTPDDATNCAKARYLGLIGANATITTNVVTAGSTPTIDPVTGVTTPGSSPTTTPTTVALTLDPATKAKIAKAAMNDAAWMVDFLHAAAEVSVIIAADSSGNGLQVSAAAGHQTTHPPSPKTLTGTLA